MKSETKRITYLISKVFIIFNLFFLSLNVFAKNLTFDVNDGSIDAGNLADASVYIRSVVNTDAAATGFRWFLTFPPKLEP